MFDEPLTYLDIKQRINAAKLIKSLLTNENYIVVIEHDLAILDYLIDYSCLFYGAQNIYGAVTLPFSAKEGINIFIDGYIPGENI